MNQIKRLKKINGDPLNLPEKINELKEREGIVILAHNYQRPEVQDVADHLGDSLELCYLAQELDAKTILFAGVRFMAESALILNPEKTVLVPDLDAHCPMASMLQPDMIIKARGEHPDAAVVLYGNTTAAAKAEADVICTSANSVKIVNSLDEDKVLFGPDKNLRYWTQQYTDKELIPIPELGYCYVHNSHIGLEQVIQLMERHPDAEVLVHPECVPEVQELADHVLSTNGMLKRAKCSSCNRFIIGTEKEMCYRLEKELPDKRFFCLESALCDDMKKTTLENLYMAAKGHGNAMTLPADVIAKAKAPLKRMLDLSR
jgi:quinolinate synthase